MLFNSLSFALFFPIVFLLYWFVAPKKLKYQNLLLLVSSYYFYACWDYRFLFLLIFSTLLDYFTGLKMANNSSEQNRKFWFWLSIGINLGFLGVFKYYNFFAESFAESLSHLGFNVSIYTLQIILPVGISFYTFHGLSYVIDIYKRRIEPEYNFVDYSVFVSFFPLLVAGPIERATHLLPQIKRIRTFDYKNAVLGCRQILWGLFKKVVIADNCAEYVNVIFGNYENHSGSTLLLAAVLFAFQIYGDFSGYSDIALGTARLLGFDLLRNFNFPYFSRNIAEFWRRWHISLSSWFKDYLYIPLGGSAGGMIQKVRNTFVIFLISGFWHGANWTFIVWGLLNALYIMPSIIFKTERFKYETVAQGRLLPSVKEFFAMMITFCLTVLAWIFFRAETVTDAGHFIKQIFSTSTFTLPNFDQYILVILIVIFMIIEWLGREQRFAIEYIKLPKVLRWSFYIVLAFVMIYYHGTGQEFIYFQF